MDAPDDSHLAPSPSEVRDPSAPPGLRHLSAAVGSFGRFVRLAERQGTRLVDLMERWVEAAEDHNRQSARLAEAAERLAEHADSYLGWEDPADE